jgi:putative transposase
MNIKMLKKLIEEEYKVKYSYKQVWVIARKLGYSYVKIYPKFSQSPEDAEYQLKKT